MPPRVSPSPSRGRTPSGGPRGRGGGRGMSTHPSAASQGPPGHIQTIGIRRPNFGTSGRTIPIMVNAFNTTIPDGIIYHYDVILPGDKVLPPTLNMNLIKRLQEVFQPQLFTPRAVYDCKKNMFAFRELPFPGGASSYEFKVTLTDPQKGAATARPPREYKIRLTKVAQINPEVLKRFIQGKQSVDNTVLTAITALNVVIRMEPIMKYPFNVRSFFTDNEKREIGGGMVLWRGYFQSVRPAIGKMLINVDISTGCMYKPGPLINLCMEFFGSRDANSLARSLANERDRHRLQRFVANLRIKTRTRAGSSGIRVLKKITSHGADRLSFSLRETNTTLTVADYFRQAQNRQLQYPSLPCVEVANGAFIPLELCEVPVGQIIRKQIEKSKEVLEFATKRPPERLASIRNGLGVLNYGQSEYVRQFGMNVDVSGPIRVTARVLKPPTLKYGEGSKQATITPRDGAWNMIDKKFYKPAAINQFVVVVYERRERFNPRAVEDVIRGLVNSCRDVGIKVPENAAAIQWENGQGVIANQLRAAGGECKQKTGVHPNLVVVILPEGGNDIYTAVKHFGDVTAGVATQCLKAIKCHRAKPQYYANVCLKVNVKLGGINTIPEPATVSVLTDPHNPTIVLGADAVHPAPGSEGRPSFTALVGNVDSDTAKYIADIRVQESRQEIIADLYEMSHHILGMYMKYREKVENKGAKSAPKRIIFYRDGVSEGQFKHVLEQELPELKRACAALNINPAITVIIVGKRHHFRFFPQNERDGDRSGNCPAGTVVDTEIAHPVEFDWYLQSHGGLLGTSRPAHYNVVHDENGFSADGLESLSYSLCHVYARATRSVSIPAPVYYADIVCARAKNHYDPTSPSLDFSDSATQSDSAQALTTLELFKKNFKPLHRNMATVMYFS